MKNQDPTNPMDNSQLTSQLAQLSTVQGISQLNSTLGTLMSSLAVQQPLQAASMIQRSVLAPGNNVQLTSNTTKAADGTETTTQNAVFGVQLAEALKVAEKIDATVVDMRFVKPLDEALVREIAAGHELLVTVEENAIMGGAGAAVSEFLARENILKSVLHLGLPDVYVEHAKPAQMLAECGLDEAGIEASVRERMTLLGL